jgi:hypothetical protein
MIVRIFLAALKTPYDPDNVLHLNQNIKPGRGITRTPNALQQLAHNRRRERSFALLNSGGCADDTAPASMHTESWWDWVVPATWGLSGNSSG